MMTIVLVWSSSLLFYFVAVIAAIIYESIKGNEVDIDSMALQDRESFKRRASLITMVGWGALAMIFYSGSYEWAIGLASLLVTLTTSALFSYSAPTPTSPCKTESNMSSGLFVWAVTGIVLSFILI